MFKFQVNRIPRTFVWRETDEFSGRLQWMVEWPNGRIAVMKTSPLSCAENEMLAPARMR